MLARGGALLGFQRSWVFAARHNGLFRSRGMLHMRRDCADTGTAKERRRHHLVDKAEKLTTLPLHGLAESPKDSRDLAFR